MLSKIIILALAFIVPDKIADPVSIQNKTEIFIIGTVHESTENFNSDTLVNILDKIKPDVILIECDTSYMTKDFKLKDDIKHEFTETEAITKYTERNSVVLRPYDISGRDIFLDDDNRKTNEAGFFYDISDLYETGKLNNSAIQIYDKIRSMIEKAGEMSFSKASYINSSDGSSVIDSINYYTYTGLQILIKETPGLSKYKSYWDDECAYWNRRNETMLENILKYEKYFKGKKIIVLCGFAHKNYLKIGLLKNAGDSFIVKEFWEN